MTDIPLGEPTPSRPTPRFALFELGFRPFFSLAGLSAIAFMAIWLGSWASGHPSSDYYGMVTWHSHEMLFGYSIAVIAGFLLTATRNWTGMHTPEGKPLAVLVGIWLAGRIAPFLYPIIPASVVAIADLLFLPAVLLALYTPLMSGGNKSNRVFLLLFAGMTIANLLIHLESLGYSPLADTGITFMLNLVLLLLTFLAGRVMPFFTDMAIPGAKSRTDINLERAVYGSLFALVVVELFYPAAWLIGAVAFGVALTQGMRLAGWYTHRIWSIPILWILFTAYGWMIIGFAMKAAAAAGWLPINNAIHALTVGAVGTLTLGMMARVSLGHTGRELRTSRLVYISFILLNLGVVARVIAPIIIPQWYNHWIHLSGTLWIAAFALFSTVYLPILIQSRIDGRPG